MRPTNERAAGAGTRTAREYKIALTKQPNHALTAAQQEELAQAPSKYRALLRKAFERAISPRKAIQANCLTCTHFNVAEIRDCSVLRCALRPYRPYQQESAES